MSNQDFAITFVVDETPEEVFAAITNVRGWWSRGIEGDTAKVGDEFTYRHKRLHRSTQRMSEAVPARRVVWRVVAAELSHAENRTEWTGTELQFDLVRKHGRTELRFTHVGLSRGLDCFEACARGWDFYVGDSLRRLITTGVGKPDPEAFARGAA
ncbi:Hypothetical protein I5071_44330 [Sandaracinus amylolyticus]|nr:Hypothetical protein I5071_44330 [Sandaracinus amylolyticus]